MSEPIRRPAGDDTPREVTGNCADVVLRLFEYVDNETVAADTTVIKSHLDECGSCLREYERDIILKALIRRACGCEPAPEALRSQIMTSITQITQIRVERRRLD